ncbi:hypothetical protein R6Q59_009497 [Mikania micrantha]
MEDQSIPVFFFIALIMLSSGCAAVDSISANQEIKDGNTLVSEGEMLELELITRMVPVVYPDCTNSP